MNVLDYLDSKGAVRQTEKHPLAEKRDEFKWIYCFGIATLAFGYKKNLPDIGRYYSELLRSMDVDEKKEKQIISAVNTVFDFKITEVFEKGKEGGKAYWRTRTLMAWSSPLGMTAR